MRWVFSTTLEEFPELQEVNFFGFRVKNIDRIIFKRLDELEPERVENLLKKLYKGLGVYYS